MNRSIRLFFVVAVWLWAVQGDVWKLSAKETGPPARTGIVNGPLQTHPSIPHWFVDGYEKPTYLSGSHTQMSLQERQGQPKLSFELLLQFLVDHGHNFTKLWIQEDAFHSPLPFQRTGPAPAVDGKPRFDLSTPNQEYFDELRSRAEAAQAHGMYIAVMLFNGWSIEGKTRGRKIWDRHPFHRDNNVNGIDGDQDRDGEGTEVHTLKNRAITAIQEAYVRKVIDSISDLDNVLYEISNESASTPDNTAWQYHMIDFIHEHERTKPNQHPVGMTVQWPDGDNRVLYESPADWISPNSNDGYRDNPPAENHGKIVLNDTDHLWGNGGNAGWVWKSFMRGLNPIFVDSTPPLSKQYELAQAEEIRAAMGDTLAYTERIDLVNMKPREDLCSTTFCLVNPGKEYLIYFPPTRWCSVPFIGSLYQCRLTLDLSGDKSVFDVEWFSPDSKNREPAGKTAGGVVTTFIPPFRGSSVLHLKVHQAG
jgi:hypothetical protein